MILSHGRRYLFIHIPKTGGTSLSLALESRAMKDDILLGDTPKALRRRHRVKDTKTRGRLWKHATLRDIDGLVGPDDLTDLFIFTMVRNPWDRMVSLYHWLQNQDFDHPSVALAQTKSFGVFLTDPMIRLANQRNPAAHYVTDVTGIERAAAYIRLEHFDVDAAPLWRHLGFELTLPHENRSDRRADYQSAYTMQTRRIVEEDCAEDIARFGYRY